MLPDPGVVIEIAAELAVEPGFVEKDWYAVQVLAAIATHQNNDIATVFCGGTNLSKGYGLLKRFSEDLDFRGQFVSTDPKAQNKSSRRQFRTEIISLLQKLETISSDEIEPDSGGNYFKFALDYPGEVEHSTALRSGLKVEYSFTQSRLGLELRPIRSFVSEFLGLEPETQILCLSPVETAADKLSALTWRVLKRDRGNVKDDPAMIRHLHDLCALSSVIEENKQLFVETTLSSFEEDQQSGKRGTNLSINESMKAAYQELKNDAEYEREYVQFVDAMSYADDAESISFNVALENFERQISIF
jgi:hypothetical protein